MAASFDLEERAELATQMTQVILDDHGFLFASHLKMSMVAREGVSGLTAHACDYYEITKDLKKNRKYPRTCLNLQVRGYFCCIAYQNLDYLLFLPYR